MIRVIAILALCLASPAIAQNIAVEDAYFRTASPVARAGAAFMTLANRGETDDRLVAVRSDIAARAELHTHVESDGVMQMRPLEDGIALLAGGSHRLERGGDHVMFMGLTARPETGETIAVLLVFERAGEIAVEIAVDNERAPAPAN